MEHILRHEVIIVGGGVAGLRAAIAAHDSGAEVAVVSKVHPARSASVGAQGGISASLNNVEDGDDWQIHFKDTLHSGSGLCDEEPVKILCQEAPEAILELDRMGVFFNRMKDNKIAQRPYGGHTKSRVCYAGDRTGQTILHTLWGQCIKRNILFYNNWYVWKLIVKGYRLEAIIVFDIIRGEFHLIQAKALVLATGGLGQIFEITSNPFASTGDGMALAQQAGARLRDLEFIQFHPTGLFPRGVLISEACRAEGGYLLNKQGKRFMFDYDERGELATRDIVARGIQTEINKGRGWQGENFVALDVRHLGRDELEKKLPQALELARDFANVDLTKEILPVAPTAHYCMGGIAATLNGEVIRQNAEESASVHQSVMQGLYAAGECTCLSVHGANRLGCNSLLDGIVFGRRAGTAASRWTDETDFAGFDRIELEAVKKGAASWIGTAGDKSIGQLKSELQKGMTQNCGIFRNEPNLKKQLDSITELKTQLQTLLVSRENNWAEQLIAKKELVNMLQLAREIVEAAKARKESMGAHWRDDA